MMKSKNNGLAGVDAFGLDEFGVPAGINPMWGTVVGTGLGTLTAIGTRQFTRFGRHSELVGFAAGAVAGGGMIFFEGTRAAGWTALASAFLNNGLRQLELWFLAPKAADAAIAAVTAAAQGANAGTNGVVIDPTHEVRGAFGLPTIDPTHEVRGLGDGSELPQLVGANLAAASQHVQLVGGPSLAQHSSHWGATVIPSN